MGLRGRTGMKLKDSQPLGEETRLMATTKVEEPDGLRELADLAFPLFLVLAFAGLALAGWLGMAGVGTPT